MSHHTTPLQLWPRASVSTAFASSEARIRGALYMRFPFFRSFLRSASSREPLAVKRATCFRFYHAKLESGVVRKARARAFGGLTNIDPVVI